MGMDASGILAYGIDFGDETPAFVGDYKGGLKQWARDKGRAFDVVSHGYGHETILAVKGYSYSASYGTEEFDHLTVDLKAVEAFKSALIAAGYDNPRPKWILAVEVSV
jgi:hypothetical protein